MNNTNTWSQIGAWQGGSVSSILLSPNYKQDGIAIAATSAGLFRTDTFAQSWSLSMSNFSDPSALALASGQTHDGPLLLASSEQRRLFRSHDLGITWSEIEAWAGLGIGSAIAISPDFATDKTFFVATSEGIFRTLDDGVTWQEASFGLLDLDVICLALAPDFAQSQTVWVGTALGGLFRSRNAGRAWRESGEGLPDCAVQSIVLSPNFATDQTLFAGMEAGSVYRSMNGGRSWELAGEALAEIGVNALAVFASPLGVTEYGLLAGTAIGIYASSDSGETWTIELADRPILDLALTENGSGLAALYQDGIVARNLASGEWHQATSGIIAHAPPQVVQGGNNLLLALDSDGELALSQNAGADWQSLRSPDETSPTVAIGYAAIKGEECFYAASMANLYRLPTGASEWQPLLAPPLSGEDTILQLAVASATDRVSIALGTLQGDVLRLDDDQRRWQRLEQPWRGVHLLSLFFAEDDQGQAQLHAVTAAENAQQNYAIELWSFENEWLSLAVLESEAPTVLTLTTRRSIFLATQNRLIRLFTNPENGELEVAQHFFAEDIRVTSLAKSAASSNIYVATTSALHCSTDDGVTWDEGQAIATTQPIVSILSDAQTSKLIVGTLGGIFWLMDCL